MKKPKPYSLFQYFSSDRVVLGICILLSLFFWLLVKLSQEFVTNRIVKIDYILPEDRSFTEMPPQTVLATVRGSGWNLLSNYLVKEATAIEIILPEKESFTLPASILENKIQQEFKSLDVFEVDLDYLLFNTAIRSTKIVPIRLIRKLTFADNFQIKDSILLQPDSITVTGPPIILDTITGWPTTLFEVSNLKTTISKSLDVEAPINEVLRINPSSIEVILPVEEFTQKDLFIPVQVLNAPDSLKIFPKTIRVSCLVGLSKYDSLTSQNFLLQADFKNVVFNSSNNTLPVNITQSPPYVSQVKLDKQSVEFYLVAVPEENSDL